MVLTGDSLIELMFQSMTDIKVVETIGKLGLEQPILDEKFELDQEVCTVDEDVAGVGFCFKEIKDCSDSKEPCLATIEFHHDKTVNLPFNLSFQDDYSSCCNKLGKKADFNDKWSQEGKSWLWTSKDNKKYTLSIEFENELLSNINYLLIVDFNESDIGSSIIENKE